jgi:hypothetical protein
MNAKIFIRLMTEDLFNVLDKKAPKGTKKAIISMNVASGHGNMKSTLKKLNELDGKEHQDER